MIKAVIFDMDGTLVDSEPLWQRIVIRTYGDLGIRLTPAERLTMHGRTPRENAEHLFAQQPWEGPAPAAVADGIVSGVVELVRTAPRLRLMPGVDQALQVCKRAKLPVAIASSAPLKLIEAVVDRLKIREHFEHIYSAEVEPYGKPHPGVFITVAKRLGAKPAECLVFEDSPAGVLAAKAARMKCIAVPLGHSRDHSFIRTADLVIDSLERFDAAMLEQVGAL